MIYIRPSLPGDTWLIKTDLRQCEIDELAALGTDCDENLRVGFATGEAHTAFIDNEPAAMFGIIAYEDHNVIWAVFTSAIDRHPVAFIRASLRIIHGLQCDVQNYVDARNAKALDWFKWLGFEVSDAVEVNGAAFHRVQLRTCARIAEAA